VLILRDSTVGTVAQHAIDIGAHVIVMDADVRKLQRTTAPCAAHRHRARRSGATGRFIR
jgi:hypothetical protein